jgi:ABC-2 type transport system permease protein
MTATTTSSPAASPALSPNRTAGLPRAATVTATASAEWLKLRSLRSTWWFVAGSLGIMALVASLEADDGDPTTRTAVTVVVQTVAYFVQYLLAMLGMLVITGEFASRSITVTVVCTPSRGRVLVAKAVVVFGAVLGAGLATAALGVAVVGARTGELGSLTASELGSLLAIGLYLALLAVVALGIGTLVRRTAGGFALLVLLVLVVPEILRMLSERFDLAWLATVGDLTPAPAGYRLMLGEWEYGLVLAGWAVAMVLAGTVAMRSRDT